MASFVELVKKFIPLNVIFGSIAVKLSGIDDRNNIISGDFIFQSPNKIIFLASPPSWILSDSDDRKYIRITVGGGLNNTKLFSVESLNGNEITVSTDNVDNFTGFATIDGRVWAVINDAKIAKATNTGSTMYNVHNRQPTNIPGDASAVAIPFAEHYHDVLEDPDDDFGELLFHKRNSIGEFHLATSSVCKKLIPIGPLLIVDRCGNAIRTKSTKIQSVDICFPKASKCPGETCNI